MRSAQAVRRPADLRRPRACSCRSAPDLLKGGAFLLDLVGSSRSDHRGDDGASIRSELVFCRDFRALVGKTMGFRVYFHQCLTRGRCRLKLCKLMPLLESVTREVFCMQVIPIPKDLPHKGTEQCDCRT